jgi:DNA-nicking Smr family endonuclease
MRKRRPTQPASVEPEDALAFRAAVADVKPLKHPLRADGGAAQAGQKPKPRVRRRSPASAMEDLNAVMPLIAVAEDGSAASSAVVGETVLGFQRAGVRIQEMRKLRRGLFPAQDQLDLHGFTQAAARDQLADFIVASRDAGLRCVRVIHGKGYRNGGRGAVLKTAVDLWLRRHMDVLAFTSAKAIDGGTGALYVLLRG